MKAEVERLQNRKSDQRAGADLDSVKEDKRGLAFTRIEFLA